MLPGLETISSLLMSGGEAWGYRHGRLDCSNIVKSFTLKQSLRGREDMSEVYKMMHGIEKVSKR